MPGAHVRRRVAWTEISQTERDFEARTTSRRSSRAGRRSLQGILRTHLLFASTRLLLLAENGLFFALRFSCRCFSVGITLGQRPLGMQEPVAFVWVPAVVEQCFANGESAWWRILVCFRHRLTRRASREDRRGGPGRGPGVQRPNLAAPRERYTNGLRPFNEEREPGAGASCCYPGAPAQTGSASCGRPWWRFSWSTRLPDLDAARLSRADFQASHTLLCGARSQWINGLGERARGIRRELFRPAPAGPLR